MLKFLSFFRRHWLASLFVILAVLSIWGYQNKQSRASAESQYQTTEVRLAQLTEEVSLTGRLKDAERLDLSMEGSGRIAYVKGKVGSKVKAGDMIVSVGSGELQVQLKQAMSNLEREKIRLRQLEAGNDLSVGRAGLNSAEVALTNAKTAYENAVGQAYISADNILGLYVDQFFANPRHTGPDFGLSINTGTVTYFIGGDGNRDLSLESQRAEITSRMSGWKADNAESILTYIQQFLNELALVVNSYQPSDSGAQLVYNGYKTDVSLARTSTNAAISTLQAAKQALQAAQTNYDNAKEQYDLKVAPGVSDDIALQRINVDNAESQVELIRLQLAKNAIVSPINGTIVEMKAKVGEMSPMGQPLVSVISDQDLEIEVKVPEMDIGRVKAGNFARLTTDAFPGQTYEAKVVYVSMGETMVEGLATYKATLHLTKDYPELRPGLTADLEIVTASKDNVLVIPQRAVITKNGQRLVRVLENGLPVEKPVVTGIRGVDGSIEVAEGLQVGQAVITSKVE